MSARYLIRMDDACPTMDISKWQALEELFDDYGIKPIVAVVPDNHDPKLNVDTFDFKFWDKVRSWQDKGWTIAMHGHRHLMHYTESKLVLPFYKRSEFAGLPYEEQAEKIRQAWKLFVLQKIEPTVWIAPAHCFDFDTLKAIHDETPIRIVSDGIACNTYYEYDFFWIPQQLWELSERSSGLWTVCLHPNTMHDGDISHLRDMIERKFLNSITGVNVLNLSKNPQTLIDRIYGVYFWKRRRAYQYFDKVKSLLR
jgi:predicted deacetylase